MTENTNGEPFGEIPTGDEPSYAYQPPKKKSGVWKWILIAGGALAILGVGTCTYMFVGLFEMTADRKAATIEFVDKTLQNRNLPMKDDEIWSDEISVNEKAIGQVEFLIEYFDTAKSIEEPTCGANTVASTNRASGTYVTCVTDIEYETTTGRIEMVWKKAGDDWKINHFYTLYDDEEAVEKALAEFEDQTANASSEEPKEN